MARYGGHELRFNAAESDRWLKSGKMALPMERSMLSNANVYLAIAEEALAESKQLDEASQRPKPDGQPGFVITYDPEHTSFKQSLIAMVFAGIYLEALLYIVGMDKLGKDEYMKIDRKHYEEKLRVLGVTDTETLTTCKRFREARNDLVHEKAIEPHVGVDGTTFHTAQREAEIGVSFVRSIASLLLAPLTGRSGGPPSAAADL
jgi:hypothetical protein